MITKDLGMVTAYAYAVSKGYTGTETEFAELMASYATVAQEAVDAALAAAQSAQSARDAQTAAEGASDTAQATVSGAIAGIQAEGHTQIGAVRSEGTAQVGNVNSAGQTQVGNVNAAGTTQVENVNTAGSTQVSAVQAKGTEVLNSIPSDYTELSDDVAVLKSALDEYTDTTYSNLLVGKTPVASWYIDPDTGEGRSLGSFYSYTGIDVSEYVGKKIYPRSDDSQTNYTSRSIVFYQADGTTRTGGSGNSQTIHDNGINIPANTKYMSLTFRNAATETFAGVTPNDTVNYALNKQVAVDYSQIKNIESPDTNNKRFPAICFEFDDGNANDADIVNIFKAKGLTCGFALIATGTHAAWLGYQDDGFEILSHSTDGTGMDDASVAISTIETKLKNSLSYLENEGFNVKGFVTPNSTMNKKFKPLLRKYYQFAETEYLREYTGTQTPYRLPVNGVYNGFRVSLQSTTLANQKAAVDECIANYGCLTFYGHSANLDTTDNLTTNNLNSLLDYINGKVSNGECVVGNPSNVIIPYFNVRNDDVSDGWIEITKEEAELDTTRYTATNWYMAYNNKLKLLHFMVRITPKENISGQINPLFKIPVSNVGNDLVMNELGRNCLIYGGGLLVQGSGTWSSGDSKRFSVMTRIK